jgi:hypothetical protein
MGKLIDFDAWRAEQKSEPVKLTLGGRVYDLPPSMPASLALDVVRMNSEDPNAEVPEDMVISVGAAVFGSEALFNQVLRDHNITLDELPNLIRMVMDSYTGSAAPNREARRKRAAKVIPFPTPSSSPNGASSKPTSPGSTTST